LLKKGNPASESTRAPTFNDLASTYDEWFDGEGKLLFAIELHALQDILPSLPKPWLEIGVGSGRFAQALGIETGIDPSTKMLEITRKRGITAFLGRGEQQPFSEEAFGTAFLIFVLCFVDSPLDVLKETHRILAPSGKLVLGVFLKESPWGKFYAQKKTQGHRFYKHATFYRYNEVVKMLERAGFSVDKVVSTLFQKPGGVEHMELPRNGYFPDAGFTIIVAEKHASRATD